MRKPDKRTIIISNVGVIEWNNLAFYPGRFYRISKKFKYPKLRNAIIQIFGPGETCRQKAKVVNRILKIKNKTLMVKIIYLEHKSKNFRYGDHIQLKPSQIKPFKGK